MNNAYLILKISTYLPPPESFEAAKPERQAAAMVARPTKPTRKLCTTRDVENHIQRKYHLYDNRRQVPSRPCV